MFREERKFKNSRNLTLSAIYEGENRSAPIVVMCHGFQSSKDNPITSRALAQKLTERRLSVLRFDFTGHGESEGNFNEIDPITGLDDLKCAIKSLGKRKIAFYGSSFGGYVALLQASDHPVLALALKAPVSDWREVQISANRGFRFRQAVNGIDIYKLAKNIKTPTLIIHGDQDDVVPIEQSQKLLKSIGSKDRKLKIIRGADHDIRGADLERVNTLIATFFKENLLN